jgi:hypothetical protein
MENVECLCVQGEGGGRERDRERERDRKRVRERAREGRWKSVRALGARNAFSNIAFFICSGKQCWQVRSVQQRCAAGRVRGRWRKDQIMPHAYQTSTAQRYAFYIT